MQRTVLICFVAGVAIIALCCVSQISQIHSDKFVSMFFPDPGLMGRSTRERQMLRARRGADFQTVQNEFSVRRSDLYGHLNGIRSAQQSLNDESKKSGGVIQSLALAKSDSPLRVQLPVVRVKPDPIVSMAIRDMENVHARRYSAQVTTFFIIQ
jgi:hypothetical protein